MISSNNLEPEDRRHFSILQLAGALPPCVTAAAAEAWLVDSWLQDDRSSNDLEPEDRRHLTILQLAGA
jgi:hypothetical protein